MSAPTTTEGDMDVERACQIWEAYQREHDVSDWIGQAAGIDPVSGRVWFGESAIEVANNMRTDGISRPLYFVRVGYDYYCRKGGHK